MVAIHKKARREFAVKVIDRSKMQWGGRDALQDEIQNMKKRMIATDTQFIQGIVNQNNTVEIRIALNEFATALLRRVFKRLEFISAFVKIKDNIVAKLGAIMPEPLAIPQIFTSSSPTIISS